MCIHQYLGVGIITYNTPNAFVYTTTTQMYYCTKQSQSYNCQRTPVPTRYQDGSDALY
jgi:hypothetical protein